jgi:hypothetical protein
VKSRNTSPTFSPAEVPNTPVALLNKVRTAGGLHNIVSALNTTREGDPLVRFRQTDHWEVSRGVPRYSVQVYDLAKDMETHSYDVDTLTEVRAFLLGIISLRRFRKNLKPNA